MLQGRITEAEYKISDALIISCDALCSTVQIKQCPSYQEREKTNTQQSVANICCVQSHCLFSLCVLFYGLITMVCKYCTNIDGFTFPTFLHGRELLGSLFYWKRIKAQGTDMTHLKSHKNTTHSHSLRQNGPAQYLNHKPSFLKNCNSL